MLIIFLFACDSNSNFEGEGVIKRLSELTVSDIESNLPTHYVAHYKLKTSTKVLDTTTGIDIDGSISVSPLSYSRTEISGITNTITNGYCNGSVCETYMYYELNDPFDLEDPIKECWSSIGQTNYRDGELFPDLLPSSQLVRPDQFSIYLFQAVYFDFDALNMEITDGTYMEKDITKFRHVDVNFYGESIEEIWINNDTGVTCYYYRKVSTGLGDVTDEFQLESLSDGSYILSYLQLQALLCSVVMKD